MSEYIDKSVLIEKAKKLNYGSVPFAMLYDEPVIDVVSREDYNNLADLNSRLLEVTYKLLGILHKRTDK